MNEDDSCSSSSEITRKRKSSGAIDESDSELEEESDGSEDDNDEDACPICLAGFTDQLIAIPETCQHEFCNDCLQEWTKNINNCPVDRKKFNSISVYAKKNGEILEEVYIEDKVVNDEIEEVAPTFCQLCNECNREDVLLLCDECDNGYHLDCLDPPLSHVPIEEWYCSQCRPSSNSEDENQLIGDEDTIMSAIQRGQCNMTDTEARSMMFSGNLTRRKARTVASARGRSRGRRRGRGRSRGSHSRSAGSSSRGRRKTPKKKKKRKMSRASKKKVEKMKKDFIDEELRKFREKIKTRHTSGASFSVYGDEYALNDFDLDDENEEWYKTDEVKVKPCISATNDVVSDILGGLETLRPENVVVRRDGSLIPKKLLEENTKKENDVKVVEKVRHRRVKFIDDDSDLSDDEKPCSSGWKKNNAANESSNPDKIDGQVKIIPKSTKQAISREAQRILEVKKRQNELKKKCEMQKSKELEEEIKKVRQTHAHKEYKDYASMHTLSKFKIPKKPTSANVSEEILNLPKESIPSSTSEKLSHILPKQQNQVESQKRMTSNKSTHQIRIMQSNMSLEKKCQLYLKGQFKNTCNKIASSPVIKGNIEKSKFNRNVTTTTCGSNNYPSTTNRTSNMLQKLPHNNIPPCPVIRPLKSSILRPLKSPATTTQKYISLHDYKSKKNPIVTNTTLKEKSSVISNINIRSNTADHRNGELLRCEECSSNGSLDCELNHTPPVKNTIVKSSNNNNKLLKQAIKNNRLLKNNKNQLFEDLFGEANLEESLLTPKNSTKKMSSSSQCNNINKNNPFVVPVSDSSTSLPNPFLPKSISTITSPFDKFLNEISKEEKLVSSKQKINPNKERLLSPNRPIAVVAPSPRAVTLDLTEDFPQIENLYGMSYRNLELEVSRGTPPSSSTVNVAKSNAKKIGNVDQKTGLPLERIEEMKTILKIYYKNKEITKEEYKSILKLAVKEVRLKPDSYVGNRLKRVITDLVYQVTIKKRISYSK